MATEPKVADLPMILRSRAETGIAHHGEAWSQGVRFAANQLESALSQQPSAAGVPEGYVLVQQRDAHALAEWGKATAKPDGRSGVVWISARRVSDLLASAPEQRAAPAEQQGAGDVYSRLHEIAHRDSAVSVTVRADDLSAILAARQPVGQEPVVTGDERAQFKSWWDSARPLEGGKLAYEIAWSAWQSARQTYGQIVAWYWPSTGVVCSAEAVSRDRAPTDNAMPLYAAPPAQAVDLGQFREAVRYSSRALPHKDLAEKMTELLALIDQQAGNGNDRAQ